jgi:hypothetical protein
MRGIKDHSGLAAVRSRFSVYIIPAGCPCAPRQPLEFARKTLSAPLFEQSLEILVVVTIARRLFEAPWG